MGTINSFPDNLKSRKGQGDRQFDMRTQTDTDGYNMASAYSLCSRVRTSLLRKRV